MEKRRLLEALKDRLTMGMPRLGLVVVGGCRWEEEAVKRRPAPAGTCSQWAPPSHLEAPTGAPTHSVATEHPLNNPLSSSAGKAHPTR